MMEIRASEGDLIRVAAESGASVELRLQGTAVAVEVVGDGAEIRVPAGVQWGARREIEGEVWRNKERIRLMVEKGNGD